jgi:hypothetical protein
MLEMPFVAVHFGLLTKRYASVVTTLDHMKLSCHGTRNLPYGCIGLVECVSRTEGEDAACSPYAQSYE